MENDAYSPDIVETLRSYVPSLVAGHIVTTPAQQTDFSSERFPAAVLLTDVSGFTPLTESLIQEGPSGVETLSRLLDRYFGDLIDIILDQGGDVVRFAGDALIAVWPVKDEGLSITLRRAIQCGFELRSKFNTYDAGHGVQLDTKISVAVGEILSAHVEADGARRLFLLAGEPFDRLEAGQRNAQPGDLLVSSETLAHVGEMYRGVTIAEDYVRLDRIPNDPLPPPNLDQPVLSSDAESALRAYIPRAVLSKLDAGQGQWIAEFRRVSALFIRVSGVNHDTPNALDTLQTVTGIVQASLSRYEGVVKDVGVDDKGTTLAAAFGVPPDTHEDDVVRALLAAQDIQRNLSEVGISTAIGVATGRMFCGPVGNNRRREYAMFGNEMNLAGRLMQTAKENDILCDDSTYQMANHQLQFENLPAFVIKGKENPVKVYRLIERGHESIRFAPMVGRQSETTVLKRQIGAVLDGADSLAILEGEPGIGKSRILGDLLETARASNVNCLVGAADAIERSTPYFSWRAIFSQLFGLDANMDISERRARVLSQTEDDQKAKQLAPLLDAMLSLDLPDNEFTSQMTGQVKADNLTDLLALLLTNEARKNRVLVIVDDVHWMDSASWNLILHLVQRVRGVMFVIAMRPMADPVSTEYKQLVALPQSEQLFINLLSEEDSRTQICHLLGIPGISETLADLIYERARGNPYFTEELVRSLRQSETIIVDDGVGQLVAQNGLDPTPFPDSIQGIITSRVDQLTPTQQLTLKVASIIGREFTFQALRDVLPAGDNLTQLSDDLATLQRVDAIVLDSQTPDDQVYRFKHVILQEVAYNLMTFAQRRELHRDVAEWYETTHSEIIAPFFALLAHHWTNAEVTTKSIEYLEKAGEQALLNYANEEALKFFSQVLDLDAQSGGANGELRRAHWELKLGEAFVNLGNYVDGKAHLENGLGHLGDPVPAARFKQATRLTSQLLTQILHRKMPGRFVGRASNQVDSVVAACRAYERLVEVYYFGGQMPLSMYSAMRLLNSAEAAGSAPEMAVGNSFFGAILGFVPLRGTAESYLSRALDAVQGINVDAQLLVWIGVGYYYAGVGHWQRFQEAFENVVRIGEEYGNRRRCADGYNSLLYLSLLKGDFSDVAKRSETLTSFVSGLNDPRYQVFALAGQTYSHIHANKLDEAVALLKRAQDIQATHTEIGDEDQKTEINGMLAVAHLRRSNYEGALEAALQTTNLTERSSPSTYHTFFGYAGPAEVYLGLWEAQYPLPGVADLAASACKLLGKYSRVFPIGQPRHLLSQGLCDWLRGKRPKAEKAWRKSLAVAENLEMPFDEGLAHYEIGRHLEVSDSQRQFHLGRASDLFRHCGASYNLGLADDALADSSAVGH